MSRAFILLSFLATALVVPHSAQSADIQIGQVKVASGTVVIKRGDTRMRAKPGAVLMEEDVIITAKGSAVGMTFTDNSRISLGPKTCMNIAEYSFDKPGAEDVFLAEILRGNMTAKSGEIAKRTKQNMKVKMPGTVLGVRGTEFAVRTKDEPRDPSQLERMKKLCGK